MVSSRKEWNTGGRMKRYGKKWVLIEWKRTGYGEMCCLVDKLDKKITKRWRLRGGLLWKLTATSPEWCSAKKRKMKHCLLKPLWRRETSRRLKSLPWRCFGRTADETIIRQWSVFAVLNKTLGGGGARLGKKWNVHRFLVEKPEVRRQLWRPTRRWDYNIKMFLKE